MEKQRLLTYHPTPAALRTRLNLSQSEFAKILGVSVRTIQEWEQGRTTPSGPALALLRIIDKHPEVLDDN